MRSFLSMHVLWLVLTGSAVAAPYKALYVFGDSYSDIGARYLDSDGPTAAAYLAEYMGIVLTYPQDPNAGGKSLDFAASGAPSGREPGYPGYMVGGRHWCCQGMTDQVEDFARKVRDGSIVFDPKNTLFFIAGGLNDKDLPTTITIRNLTQQISLLKEVGAYHISLALLPTQIPDFAALAERLNPSYRHLASSLGRKLHIDLRLNHWGPYFDEVMKAPSAYGISNTTSKCAGRALFDEDATPCSMPETYYYYHDGHPSTAVHRVVGDKLYREISSESLNHLQDVVGQNRQRQ
jgi:phospholipase/lecithinase/hemolysin